jgi:transposase
MQHCDREPISALTHQKWRLEWRSPQVQLLAGMSEDSGSGEPKTCVRTLRLKVKGDSYSWLRAAAIEVNRVWNYANETSFRAVRPFAGPQRWLSAFDLDRLTAGATEHFERIGSATIQRVNAEYALRRRQAKKAKLRFRISRGPKRSLGWVPFKAQQLRRRGKAIRFSGKHFRVFERYRLEGVRLKSGCFAQDAIGDWWLCVAVEHAIPVAHPGTAEVGIDLGLKTTAATSDGRKLERNTTRACSNCTSLTGPAGLDKLFVRQWTCRECGATHDRDVNADRNILAAGRCCPSVSGNESPPSALPSQTSN